jgi:UDP-3-O-[3-hydroxymyristoyl] glucosamine N-acyltransferase
MNTRSQKIFPKSDMKEFYQSFRHKISDWFPSEKIAGNGEFSFTQLVDTNKPNSICYCESHQYVQLVNRNAAITCVITNKDLVKQFDRELGIVIAENPKLEFYELHNSLAETIANKPLFAPRIRSSATIHDTALVDNNCYIGENVIIGPGVIILCNSFIDNDVIIGPNVVIGSEALEFYKQSDGTLYKIHHIGGVYLSPAVEIMANSVVTKDVFLDFTFIGNSSKIGPLCNIAHRVSIGNNCRIAGNTTIGGSAKVANNVWIGPSATISNGIQIGDFAWISLGSIVVKDVKPHQKISGVFAMEHLKALRLNALFSSKQDI